ncbi:hypothetical protein N7G274_002280 [Stereocaulon virgatum]|uniref:Aminodeoxychorismate lyase n=1 Tax=Stereocaulon virgatum TaxID=373712 RepID=A0ABR4AJE1_9LECA
MEATLSAEASPADSSTQNDFKIMTAIRSDALLASVPIQTSLSPGFKPSQFYMQDFHRDRMLAAAVAFNWPQKPMEMISNLERLLSAHLKCKYKDSCYASPLKVRVIIFRGGAMNVTSIPVPAVELVCLIPTSLAELLAQLPIFRIYISPTCTSPSPFTSHKTTKRVQYDVIRALLPSSSEQSDVEISPLLAEILLVNTSGEIMEGSITTPYFLREGGWITPAAESGGNLGTTRRYALEQGLCKESIVMKESVQLGERVVLSNGVKGFGWGFIEKLETQ